MVTLIEMYNLYGLDLFDNIHLPLGIDKELLINAILDTCNTHDFIYNDNIWAKMKIHVFFDKYYDTFTRLLEACNAEYNPIENYDRYETLQHSSSSNYRSTDRASDDTENRKSSFDSSTYENDTNSSSKSSNETSGDNNDTSHDINHIHGNIGVTTSQQMLQSELDIRGKLNIYDIIATMFYQEFCVCVI